MGAIKQGLQHYYGAGQGGRHPRAGDKDSRQAPFQARIERKLDALIAAVASSSLGSLQVEVGPDHAANTETRRTSGSVERRAMAISPRLELDAANLQVELLEHHPHENQDGLT